MELLKAILPSVIKALGSIVVVLLSWVSGKREGKLEAENEQIKEVLKASEERKRVDEEVNKLGDTELDARFSKWVRK